MKKTFLLLAILLSSPQSFAEKFECEFPIFDKADHTEVAQYPYHFWVEAADQTSACASCINQFAPEYNSATFKSTLIGEGIIEKDTYNYYIGQRYIIQPSVCLVSGYFL